ncbi:hypothetical protein J6P92_03985 [bacterium]|nr:hypothetical protein [bacterium]
MGMAASQARYLGLTARKTNVEYEGQQVNQARTALAMQAANTFNELLKLEVPTAPSQTDFVTMQYSYMDGTQKEIISEMTPLSNDPDGYNYMITHYHFSDVYHGVKTNKANPQVYIDTSVEFKNVPYGDVAYDAATTTYKVKGNEVSQYNPTDETEKAAYDRIIKVYPAFAEYPLSEVYKYTDSSGEIYFTTIGSLEEAVSTTDPKDLKVYTVEAKADTPIYVGNSKVSKYDESDIDQKLAYEQICKDFPTEKIATVTKDKIYTWQSQGKTYFATLEDLTNTAISAPDPTKPTENQSKLTEYNAEDVKEKIEQKQRAFVELDASGRPQTLRYEDSTATYAIATERSIDEAAYQDAMNQYNYNMSVYEKRIADINAKTEKIQQQDRTLELRLRQLDTEQEALQTEMEAVKKVIDKNIESTFKTFE